MSFSYIYSFETKFVVIICEIDKIFLAYEEYMEQIEADPVQVQYCLPFENFIVLSKNIKMKKRPIEVYYTGDVVAVVEKISKLVGFETQYIELIG